MTQEMNQERKRRRDAGMLQMTERDILALTWIAEMYCVSFDQLQCLLGRYAKAETKTPDKLSVSATRGAIERWLQLGLVEEPRKILSGYPVHIWLSRKGSSTLTLPYAYYRPRVSSIDHLYAVNAIRLHLEGHRSQILWYPQRALTREEAPRPLPDGEIRTQATPAIAVQVLERPFSHNITRQEELTTLTQLAQRYTRLWCFLHADTVPFLRQALATLSPQIQTRVVLYGLNAQETI